MKSAKCRFCGGHFEYEPEVVRETITKKPKIKFDGVDLHLIMTLISGPLCLLIFCVFYVTMKIIDPAWSISTPQPTEVKDCP